MMDCLRLRCALEGVLRVETGGAGGDEEPDAECVSLYGSEKVTWKTSSAVSNVACVAETRDLLVSCCEICETERTERM
jgi:hypothetical protein